MLYNGSGGHSFCGQRVHVALTLLLLPWTPICPRLDPVIRQAKATGGSLAEATIKARVEELLPAYQQMALRFADMHDTPQRM